jgi:hypothetical protein
MTEQQSPIVFAGPATMPGKKEAAAVAIAELRTLLNPMLKRFGPHATMDALISVYLGASLSTFGVPAGILPFQLSKPQPHE